MSEFFRIYSRKLSRPGRVIATVRSESPARSYPV
jgi:hypothetical protein